MHEVPGTPESPTTTFLDREYSTTDRGGGRGRQTNHCPDPCCPAGWFSKGTSYFLFVMFIILVLTLPTMMLAVGVVFMRNCPLDTRIPLYLIVFGAAVLVAILLWSLAVALVDGCGPSWRHFGYLSITTVLLIGVFCFGWLITGTVWIGGSYEKRIENSTSPFFCDETLYMSAMWSTSLIWVIVVSLLGCFLASLMCPLTIPPSNLPPRTQL